jgi:hypothetical protein
MENRLRSSEKILIFVAVIFHIKPGLQEGPCAGTIVFLNGSILAEGSLIASLFTFSLITVELQNLELFLLL